MVALLSQYSFIGLSFSIFSSFNRDFNHSQIPKAINLNSAFILDLTTIDFFFLLLYVTKLPLTNRQFQEVNCMSLIQPAKSALVYGSTFRLLVFENRSPFPGAPLRHLKILTTAFICSSFGACTN